MTKKTPLYLLFLTLTAFYQNGSKVYICGPEGSKKYHYSNSCRGLSACKDKIAEVSKTKAESLGLSLCGWED